MKQEILDYIRRPIPKGLPIVPQSIPIVFFGDIETAKMGSGMYPNRVSELKKSRY